jgi:hypothetical protein
MTTTVIALILKPFVVLIIFGLIVIPLTLLAKKYIPEGKIKRILFKKIS